LQYKTIKIAKDVYLNGHGRQVLKIAQPPTGKFITTLFTTPIMVI